jgi:membrane carboxypeptidase/penicillin-binding protein PbpC
VVGVWVGNNDNSQMKNVASGVSGAAPIWRREMLEVLSKMPDRPFETPKGVSQVEVDKISGYPAHDGFESYKEWFIDGTVPTSDDPYHLKIKVCKNQNEKLANQVQIGQGNYDLKEVLMAKEKDPLTDKDFWQKAIDGWIATKSADLRFKVPTEYCEISSGVDVKILTPGGNARVDGNAVEIQYEVYSDANIEWVDLYLDDVKEERFNNSSSGKKTYNLINGNHKLRIVARNSKGTESDRIINFGVNQDYTTPTASPSGSI